MISQTSQTTFSESTEKNTKIINFENPLLLKIKEFTIQKLIDSHKNNEELEDIIIRESEDKNILEINDFNQEFLGIVFKKPIKVKYERAIIDGIYYTLIDEKVYSNIQIKSSLDKYNILYPNIIGRNNSFVNYFDSLYTLFWDVSNNELNIINSFKECSFKENKVILMNKKEFKKEELSEYFEDYFTYPCSKKIFKYYPTQNRKNFEENCSILLNKKDINQFKLAGPSGEGKSISLLYFSRCGFNKIYFNLKTLYKLHSESKFEKYLDLLIYEFGRLKFSDPNKKTLFENEFNKYSSNNFWELLEKLSLILKGQKVLFIFDQYKEKYINRKYFKKIKENLKGNLKIIISSSTNDHEIGSECANSLIKHKGENFRLTKENQDDYFYYSDLVDIKDLKELYDIKEEKNIKLYDYFSWNPKYISLINNNKSKDDLKEHIKNKMKEHSSNLGIDFELYIFNIYLRINRETNYDVLPLKTLSLKYCKLELGKKFFKVHYKYPIVKIIIDDLIKGIDVKKYFNNKDYEDNELYSSLKCYFFEYAAIKQIKLMKNTLFEEPIKYSLTVENILNIKQYEANETNKFNADKFNMIFKQLDNQNVFGIEITKKDMLNNNLKLITDELNIRRKEIKQEEIIEEEDENEDYEENENDENSEENNDNLFEGEEDDLIIQEEKKNVKMNNKDINCFIYKNLKKEKNKIDKLLGNKTKRAEINTEEISPNKKLKLKDNLDEVVKLNIYDENFQNGAIMITQKQTNGKTLDLGVLLGEKNRKKFIGFQMKFYSKNSKLKNEITKDSIKRQIQPILVNSLKNYGIRITEWHYFMCLYYNKEDEYEFSSRLVNNCNNNDLEYIFFNPAKNKFYNSDKSILNKIKLNLKTNLDYYSIVNPYLIFKDTGFLKQYLNQAHEDLILVSEDSPIFNVDYNLAVNNIKSVLNKDVKIICKFELDKESHFPIPNDNILLLFGDDTNFLCYYNMNNQLNCQVYRINKNKFVRDFNYYCPSLIPNYLKIDKRLKKSDKLYFYVFKIKD